MSQFQPEQPQWQQPPTYYPPQQPPNPFSSYPQQQQWESPAQPYPPQYQPQMPPQQQWQQQPWYAPPPPPAPKKPGKGKFFAIGCGGLVALVVLIVLIAAIASAGSKSSTAPTSNATQPVQQATQAPSQPTQAPKWTTTHTYTGNGIKKTGIFTAPDDWKIIWKCDPSSFYGSQYNVQVFVYSSDGSLSDVAINELCKAGNTTGETEEHQGGQIYLDVNSEGSWVIQVQELK
jgi:hypothetical protein